MTTRISLEVSADIDLNSTTEKELEAHMQAALARAIGDGLLTGHTSAEVDSYSASINVENPQTRALLARCIAYALEEKNLSLDEPENTLVHFGLMLPSDFHELACKLGTPKDSEGTA